jgi:hypothetical protein
MVKDASLIAKAFYLPKSELLRVKTPLEECAILKSTNAL